MFGLRVPLISVVIGEGGSGGALAIGCANRNLIMENSVYYVASPEACAAILWKSRNATQTVGGPRGEGVRRAGFESGGAAPARAPNSLPRNQSPPLQASARALDSSPTPRSPHAPQATEALRITAPELVKLGVMDTIVPEPLGGAHADPVAAFPAIKDAIMATYREYEPMSEREIQLDRWGVDRV
jgi:acetyl-CoA carboxylase carboxyl transferase subunit alpha